MSWKEENRIQELADLVGYSNPLPKSELEQAAVMIDLRVGIAPIEIDNEILDIGCESVWLSLDLEGLRISANSRFGDPDRPNDLIVDVVRKVTTERTADGKIGGGGILSDKSPGIKVEAGGKLEKSRKVSQVETSSAGQKERLVEARPGMRWQIQEHDGSVMNSTYMQNKALCTLEFSEDTANRKFVSLTALVKKTDIVVMPRKSNGKFKRVMRQGKTQNREKVFKALVAKMLSDHLYNEKSYHEICLSTLEVGDEE